MAKRTAKTRDAQRTIFDGLEPLEADVPPRSRAPVIDGPLPPVERVLTTELPPAPTPAVPSAHPALFQQPPPSAVEEPAVPQPPPAADEAAMHGTALVFLDDPLARRLAVAWTSCRGNEGEWLAAAGVTLKDRSEAQQLMTALKVNGICRPGGVTDALALQYIVRLVAAPLMKKQDKPKEKK